MCSCLTNYIGYPPNCRAECTVNSDCPSTRACINQKCIDPCPGSCGLQAVCQVYQHSAVCTCREGYTGDPFQNCHEKIKIGEIFLQIICLVIIFILKNIYIKQHSFLVLLKNRLFQSQLLLYMMNAAQTLVELMPTAKMEDVHVNSTTLETHT